MADGSTFMYARRWWYLVVPIILCLWELENIHTNTKI